MNIEGWVALPGNISRSHDNLRENDLGRCFGREVRTRIEMRESTARPDPDRAISLRGERVQVAIVPRQTVPSVIMAPVGTIPCIHAPLCPCPKATRCIELQEIYESVGATSLDALLDRYAARLRMDTVDTAPVAVTDPHSAIHA